MSNQSYKFLAQGTFGPFTPAMEVEVPLWLAINLRKRQQCRIVPPQWLEVTFLTKILEQDTTEKQTLCNINFHYIEISSLLFNVASEDIVEVDQVRTLLEVVVYPPPSSLQKYTYNTSIK